MQCLSNRIGIQGCGAPASDAIPAVPADPLAVPPVIGTPAIPALPILFINHLPGVTMAKINEMTNPEQETFIDLWNAIVARTMAKFILLTKAAINRCHRITDNTIITCLVCNKKELFDVALWYLHGTELMIEITSSDEINRYTTIDLDKAERLKEEFFAEFQAALDDAVKSITPEDTDCIPTGECAPCVDQFVNWDYQLP